MKPTKFDPEVQIRSWALGVVALLLVKRIYGPAATVSDVEASGLGVLLGAVYDFIAYTIKRKMAEKKA